MRLAIIFCLCFVGLVSSFAAGEDYVVPEGGISVDHLPAVFKFSGDPTGGEVKLIKKGLSPNVPDETIIVQTVENDTLATLVSKFVAAINIKRGTLEASVSPEEPTQLLITGITDNVRFTSTDNGLLFPQGPTNATASFNAGKTTLSWNITAPGYDRIKIMRNGRLVSEVPGNTTSYEDGPDVSGIVVYELIGVKDGILSAAAEVSITIPNTHVVATSSLPQGKENSGYRTILRKFGGTGTVSWSIDSGTLPTGVTLTENGELSGTPTNHGTFNFVVKVADAVGAQATKSLSLEVLP